jgi:DNA replication licensing factor MCM5
MSEPNTTFTTAALEDICKKFLKQFKSSPEGSEMAKTYKFMDEIDRIFAEGKYALEIDYEDIISVDAVSSVEPEIIKEMTECINDINPEFLEAMKDAFKNIMRDHHRDYYEETKDKLVVRFINSPIQKDIMAIVPEDTGKFIEIKGIISEMTSDLPQYFTTKIYRCTNCGVITEVRNKNFFHQVPTPGKCSACGEKKTLVFDELESIKKGYAVNYNIIDIQQPPEKADMKRVGATVTCVVMGTDLVEKLVPADRIKITGFINLKPTGVAGQSSTYDPYIEVNYVTSLVKDDGFDSSRYRQQIIDIANSSDKNEIFNKFVRSIAPSVVGKDYEAIKATLLLQALGAPARTKYDKTRVRGDINIALFGAAGTAKTELAQWVRMIHGRAIASGQMSSKVGLTGAIDFTDKAKGAKVKPGLYMLGNGGLVIVDEADKLENNDLQALLGIMDDRQTLMLAKGGIVREYPIRSPSLHLANPDGGKFDNSITVIENFPTIIPPIWQRYDVVWIIKSETDEKQNEIIADSVIDSLLTSVSEEIYQQNTASIPVDKDIYESDLIRAWVEYCKEHYKPEIRVNELPKAQVEEMIKKMKGFYMSLKKSKDTADISPRVLNSYLRLVLASARGHMRNHVESVDYEIAHGIMLESIIRCGMNPETGVFDSKNLNFEVKQQKDPKELRKLAKKYLKKTILTLSFGGTGYVSEKAMEDELFKIVQDMAIVRNAVQAFVDLSIIYRPPGMPNMFAVVKDRLNEIQD